jgi:hypothetical protein
MPRIAPAARELPRLSSSEVMLDTGIASDGRSGEATMTVSGPREITVAVSLPATTPGAATRIRAPGRISDRWPAAV